MGGPSARHASQLFRHGSALIRHGSARSLGTVVQGMLGFFTRLVQLFTRIRHDVASGDAAQPHQTRRVVYVVRMSENFGSAPRLSATGRPRSFRTIFVPCTTATIL